VQLKWRCSGEKLYLRKKLQNRQLPERTALISAEQTAESCEEASAAASVEQARMESDEWLAALLFLLRGSLSCSER
jgi:hypothetical protein